MFFQIITQSFADSLVNSTGHFRVTQLCLGLSFKLRFCYLDRDHGSQTFTEVITLDFYFCLFQQFGIFGIFLQRTSQTTTEACHMRTTFDRIDVVDIREYTFIVRCIVCHGYFHWNTLFFRYDMDHIRSQFFLRAVDVVHKLFQTFVWMEGFWFVCAIFFLYPLIGQTQGNTCIQEGQFAQTCSQNIIFVFSNRENAAIRLERDGCSGCVGVTHHLHVVQRFAAREFLHIDMTVSANFGFQIGWKGIHTRNTHTMQTAGNFIRSFIEFSSGMEHGQNNFQCWFSFFLMNIDRNTTPVVCHNNRIVFINYHIDVGTITGQSLINWVVNHFVH